jgi:SAM-dependent methyltransferase
MSLTDRILRHPRLYLLWQSPFVWQKILPVAEENDLSDPGRMLDVGCGPGTSRSVLPAADYVGIDVSTDYLRYAMKNRGGSYVAADAAALPIRESACFDFVLVNSLLHHLATDQVRSMLHSLSEVLAPGGSIHILDLVLGERPSLARALARMDRGEYPRSSRSCISLFEEYFESTLIREYAVGIVGIPVWQMIYMRGVRKV